MAKPGAKRRVSVRRVPSGRRREQMLRHLGLVHMNGRIYDPFSGRFLSPDPFVQSPGNLQNYNRYGYVLNNPLSYTDPSGYFFKKLFRSITRFVKNYWKPIVAFFLGGVGGLVVYNNWGRIKPYVGTIITVAFTFMGMPFVGAFLGSIVQTAINGGNLKDLIIGMAVGAVAGYAGGPLAGKLARSIGLAARHIGTSLIRGAITGALAGATSAIVYGRNIWQAMKNGALMGMATSAVVHLYRDIQTNRFIRSSTIEASSPEARQEIIDGIRDAGQSPIGERLMRTAMRSGESISFVESLNGGSRVEGNTVFLNRAQIADFDAGMGGAIVHELGHVPAAGFGYSALQEHLNVRDTENRYRWWMGIRRETVYENMFTGRWGETHYDPKTGTFTMPLILEDTVVPRLTFREWIIRPG